MKEFLLDTSTLIDFLQGRADNNTKEIMASSELTVSAITFAELYKFTLNNGKANLWPVYKTRLSGYKIIDVTKEIGEKAAEFSHRFGMSLADSLIYATARLNDLELLTSDADDFKGKKGITLTKKTS